MSTVRRGPLAFDVTEHGPPDGDPVLLLHGFPQRAVSWAPVASRLAGRGYRCVMPDQRGYSSGARPATPRSYVVDELVADALAVLDDVVGPSGRVHLVGHDWGGIVAWQLAAHHPDRLRSLTAVSVPPLAAMADAARHSPRQAVASTYVLAFRVPGLAERLFRVGDDGEFSPRLVAMLERSGQTRAAAERDAAGMADPAALTAALNWYRALRFADSAAPPVRVPTLFVWSDGDSAITRQAALRADRHVDAPFRFVELRGVSHWIPEQAADELTALIGEHLAAHPG
jgi:pimeloyl-ACP methyl ester carboxylesterase